MTKQYLLHSVFRALGITLALVYNSHGQSYSSNDPFCVNGNFGTCRIQNGNFTNQNALSMEYNRTDSIVDKVIVDDGGYYFMNNTAQDGTMYDMVIKYSNSQFSNFKYNFKIWPLSTDASLNCSSSILYYGESGNYIFEQIPLSLHGSGVNQYCSLDINTRLTLEQLNDVSNIYLGLYNLTDNNEMFIIEYNYESTVIASDHNSLYHYYFDDINTDTTTQDSEIYVILQLGVTNINSDAIGTNCKNLSEIMENLYLNNDPENCSLTYDINFTAPEEPVYFDTANYIYRISHEKLKSCSKSFYNDGLKLFAYTTINPTVTNDDSTCFYFQEEDANTELTYTTSVEIDNESAEQFSYYDENVVSVTVERCAPTSDYVVPQTYIKATVVTKSIGDSIEINTDEFIPTLGGSKLFFGHDITAKDPGQVKSCTTAYDSINMVNITTCQHLLHTRTCENVELSASNKCILSRNEERYINDLAFTEYVGNTLFYVVHEPLDLYTNLENMEFDTSVCVGGDNVLSLTDVSTIFPPTIKIQNFEAGVAANWTNYSRDDTELSLLKDVIVRVGSGEESGLTFSSMEVSVKNLLVTLREPTGSNDVIAQVSINAGQKVANMKDDSSDYYTDPIFCSYYVYNTTDNRCQTFFSNGRNNALNNDGEILDKNVTDEVCGLSTTIDGDADTPNTDFVRFNPSVWFPNHYDRPYLIMDIQVTAVLGTCGSRIVTGNNAKIDTMYFTVYESMSIGDYQGADVTDSNFTGNLFVDYPAMAALMVLLVVMIFLIFAVFMYDRFCRRSGKDSVLSSGYRGSRGQHFDF